MTKPVITFVAALSCEAKALLDLHRAKKIGDKPFALFRAESDHYDLEILITGIGALAMAAAVAWLGGFRPVEQRVWLNIGAAGHGSMAIGEVFRVHTSADILSERKHFPPLVVRSPFANDELLSVNAPTSDYPDNGGMDMEAYAFFNTALHFSDNEAVQAVKVVSDNTDHGLENLNAQTISNLIQPHADAICEFAYAISDSIMRSAAVSLALSDKKKEVLLPDIRITHSQHQQLDAMISKLLALDALGDVLQSKILHSRSFKELSGLLRLSLDRCVPVI